MGLMDRDYWKEKQNKDAIYNPKEFRGDYSKNHIKRPQKSKWINYSLIALTILVLLISSLVEKGFRYKDFRNFISNSKETIIGIIRNPTKAMNDILSLQKSNLDNENKNLLLVDDTNKRINTNIIPTHVTEVQTNFKTKVEGIKFNFTSIY